MDGGTSVPREKADRINAFFEKCGYTKVQPIGAGDKAMSDDAAERDPSPEKEK